MEKTHQKIIATYARVSTSNQEDQETIKNQTASLREYSEENNCKIVKEYTDEGWSGDVLARPALDQLRQDAKDNKWEAILIYDPDRLARRYSYQELVMDELIEQEKEVIFVTVKAPENSEEKILHGVRGIFAEYERAKISERFRLGKIRKVKEGNVLVSEAPYGYTYIPKKSKEPGYYKVNKEESKVVKMMFTWVADEGVTIRGTITKLHKLGIKPRKSKRGVWSTSTLSTLFKNRTYIGEAHWGSTYAVVPKNPINLSKYKKNKKTSRKTRPANEWITIKVPAIISKDLFNRARAKIDHNNAFCVRNKKNKYLVAGKIYCTCGRKRTGEGPLKGKHLYYRCTDRVCCHPLPRNCYEKALNARIADELIWNEVSKLMSSPELLNNQIERWINESSQEQKSTCDTEFLKGEIAKIKKQEKRYNEAYASGIYELSELTEYLEPLRKTKRELENRLSEHLSADETKHINMPTAEEIEAFSKECVETLKDLSFDTKRGIILNVIDKVVGTKEELQVYGHIPVKSNINVKTINRNSWITKRRKINLI